MINNPGRNTLILLSELLGSLRKCEDAIDYYFDHVADGEMFNPLLAAGKINTTGNNEALPPEFFSGFGIHTLILDTLHGKLSFSERDFVNIIKSGVTPFKWREINSGLIMDDLQMLFKNSQIVEFESWSDVKDASDLWDNLRRSVIMPLKRNDFQFIFYLGDTAKKFDFEVDEVLDVIGDFTLHGHVTLVLNEQNADSLCAMLTGRNLDPGVSNSTNLREKYSLIFDLIGIDHLIIDSLTGMLLFSNQHLFEIGARKSYGIAVGGTDHFDTGYILGTLLKIDVLHSVALGLAVSGLYAEIKHMFSGRILLSYIDKWISEIDPIGLREEQLSVA